MKITTFIFGLFFITSAIGQNDHVEWNTMNEPKSKEYTVLLLDATWCSICKSAKKTITSSSEIYAITNEKVSFYSINERYENTVNWNDSTFYFVPNGINSGSHQFIEYLSKNQSIIYPTFLIFDSNYKLSLRIEGFKTESEWVSILGTILND